MHSKGENVLVPVAIFGSSSSVTPTAQSPVLMTHVKKPLCHKRRETAAGGCKLGFCGRHCWPRCDEQVHNRRTIARGREGQPRRDLTRSIWNEASELADHYIVQSRLECCMRAKLFVSRTSTAYHHRCSFGAGAGPRSGHHG